MQETVSEAHVEEPGSSGRSTAASSVEDQTVADARQDVDESSEAVYEALTARVLNRPKQAFATCDELLSFYRLASHTAAEDGIDLYQDEAEGEESEESAFWSRAVAGQISPTGTNLRLPLVDEADYVKSYDGTVYIGTVNKLLIRQFDAGREAGWSEFPLNTVSSANTEMLLDGNRLYLFRTVKPEAADRPELLLLYTAQVIELDIANPLQPRRPRIMEFPGAEYETARLVDGQVRLVLRTIRAPKVQTPYLRGLSTADADSAKRAAADHNAMILEAAQLDAWQPTFVLQDDERGAISEGLAAACKDTHLVFRPPFFTSMTLLIAFDAAQGIEQFGSVLMLAENDGAVVTESALYLIHESFNGVEVHRFDFSGDRVNAPTYVSGLNGPGPIWSTWHLHEWDNRFYVMWLGSWSAAAAQPNYHLSVFPIDRWSGAGYIKPVRTLDFVGELVFDDDVARVYGNATGEGRVYRLADFELVHRNRALVVPGGAHYLHPLDDGRYLYLSGRKGAWNGPIVAVLARSEEDRHIQPVLEIEVGLARVDAIQEHRSVLYKDDVLWFSGMEGNEHVVYGVRTTGDELGIEARLQAPKYNLRIVVESEELLLVSDREVWSYSLEDLSLIEKLPLWE